MSACAGGIKADNGIADKRLVRANACEMPEPLGLPLRGWDFEYGPLLDDVNNRCGVWGVLHKEVSKTDDKGSPSAIQ
ncbi:hypothetical protein RAE19_04270 [Rhodoferax sp. TBRC 17660]|uniref:Uncharacterized protein n=1 Tax=Rhodoferax potami TaxID=3068338 RepID=A0ABU3KJL1_9BURK|nr:hypothetical protein [Rhodoferax sp. TBRC 17660]MDT7517959.1 hypothetical protein [Rhodoferax sp. TBRC 17660]